MPGMGWMRAVGIAVVLALAVGGVSACGGGDGGGGAGPSRTSSVSASSTGSAAAVVEPRDALAAYEEATASGCTDAADCQAFMTRKLAAAGKVRAAMQAKDPSLYALPIGYVDAADAQADHFGRGNLAARGNMLAVAAPLQRMVAWFREHPEG